MITAEEARKMYLVNLDSIVKFQTEQLTTIIENAINYACENGKHNVDIDITTYNADAISNVTAMLKKNGYEFIQVDYDYIVITWL